ncbi:MAG: RecQ family ATP-dependent DNA helicase [Tannerella sp.]|jgi:ATP-dependent DNA helicase RecQ|nr:RecQ family ATP-dependent DNA helicase [Tannerella sp.]
MELLETLKKYWGYDSFRPLQEDIIRSVCAGNDTLGLMPTGGGKSITFQIPAMIMPGMCLVVTPLFALMKDQVDDLLTRGIKATSVHAGMTYEEISTQLDNCIYGGYKFLYVSPERLSMELFRSKLQAMNICLLVVDESHCISQWGYDFRPAYLRIADIRKELPDAPLLALTATATPEVVDDIQEKLLFPQKNVFRKSFSRKNLSYIMRYADDKNQTLLYLLNRLEGAVIVYVRTRKRTQEIAGIIAHAGFTVHFFHAGLKQEEKKERQNQWKDGRCRIMVATSAFGMGIDKPDVRLVIHFEFPSSLEEYFQEAGRAGRDGQQSYAVTLYSASESILLKKRVSDSYPDRHFILRVYDALGNYFQIASGFGLFTTHDFHLPEFCSVYKFSYTQTYYALRILELAGYIEYAEEPNNASRILFLVNREDLYQLFHQDPLMDEIVRVILRTYTGVFAEYAFIKESLIAVRAQTTQQEVYDRLIKLSKMRVVSYVPRKKVPQITFIRTREEPRHVTLPPDAYENRMKRDQKRLEKVMEYINEEHICRVRILLRYFGEKDTQDCKTCDICLRKTQSDLKQWEFNAVREQLVSLLADGAKSVRLLAETLPLEREKNIRVIRFLLDNEETYCLKDGRLSLKVTEKDG